MPPESTFGRPDWKAPCASPEITPFPPPPPCNMKSHFKIHDLPIPLSPDISLWFFPSSARSPAHKTQWGTVFEVELWGTPDEIHLTVSDSGAGFDIDAAKASRGLGLISMEERLKLLNGTLSIESQRRLLRGSLLRSTVRAR